LPTLTDGTDPNTLLHNADALAIVPTSDAIPPESDSPGFNGPTILAKVFPQVRVARRNTLRYVAGSLVQRGRARFTHSPDRKFSTNPHVQDGILSQTLHGRWFRLPQTVYLGDGDSHRPDLKFSTNP
jgi:hypothetical protein